MKALIYYMDQVVEYLFDEEISGNLTKILHQEIRINTSAVYCVMKAFKKILQFIEQSVENLKVENSDAHRKQFLTKASFLSKFVSESSILRLIWVKDS